MYPRQLNLLENTGLTFMSWWKNAGWGPMTLENKRMKFNTKRNPVQICLHILIKKLNTPGFCCYFLSHPIETWILGRIKFCLDLFLASASPTFHEKEVKFISYFLFWKIGVGKTSHLLKGKHPLCSAQHVKRGNGVWNSMHKSILDVKAC